MYKSKEDKEFYIKTNTDYEIKDGLLFSQYHDDIQELKDQIKTQEPAK